jgi:hypothetical protein
LTYLSRFGQSTRILKVIHALLSGKSIVPVDHLNKCMTLLLIDNASLNLAKAAEDVSNLTFRSAGTAYK